MKILLASQSPRRRELLAKITEDFSVECSECNEDFEEDLSPEQVVKELSLRKAKAVAKKHPDFCVIGADTVVVQNGEILGKPKDEADARRMLLLLSGRSHSVFTGISLVFGEKMISDAVETKVRFRPLSEEEIAWYVATKEPMDKAGAYGIQGKGSLLVEGIEGDYFNVMGLPVCRLNQMLKKMEETR